MWIEWVNVNNIISRAVALIVREVDPDKIILFGSRMKAGCDENDDGFIIFSILRQKYFQLLKYIPRPLLLSFLLEYLRGSVFQCKTD